MLKVLSNLVLKTSKDGGYKTSLGNLFHWLFSEQQPFFISSRNKLFKWTIFKLQEHSDVKENEVPQGEHEKGQKVFQNKEKVTKKTAIENPGTGTGQKEQLEKTSTKSSGGECK